MQIFVLDAMPYTAAKYHCDKHIVKMVLEYAQLLSTAHRVLRCNYLKYEKPNGKRQGLFLLDGEEVKYNTELGKYQIVDPQCYNATHINHPCALWARETDANYHWLVALFTGCLREYKRRYHKEHSVAKLLPFFECAPAQITRAPMTPFALAIPDQYKVTNNAIASYRAFYVGEKARFAKWTNTDLPPWFEQAVKDTHDITHFARTR